MGENFCEELENRRAVVEKLDFDIQSENRDHFRSFWLHMIILSSAIVIGILPIMNGSTLLIKSMTLAKLGLLIIILVCVLVIFYFQNMLSMEKSLLFDQVEFHKETFSKQLRLLEQAEKDGRSEKEIGFIFDKSKNEAFIKEQQIVAKHLIGGKFAYTRLFIDKYFNYFVSYGFAFGVLLVILSFVLRI